MADADGGFQELKIEDLQSSCHGPFDCTIECELTRERVKTKATCFLQSDHRAKLYVMTTFDILLSRMIVNLVTERIQLPAHVASVDVNLPAHVANVDVSLPLPQRLFHPGHSVEKRKESIDWFIEQVNELIGVRDDSTLTAYVGKSKERVMTIKSVGAGLYCQEIGENDARMKHSEHEKCMNAVLFELSNARLNKDVLKSLTLDRIGTMVCLVKDVIPFPQVLPEVSPQNRQRIEKEQRNLYRTNRRIQSINFTNECYNKYANSKEVTPIRPEKLARGRFLIEHDNCEHWTELYEGLAVYKVKGIHQLRVDPETPQQSVLKRPMTYDSRNSIRYAIVGIVAMYTRWAQDDAQISNRTTAQPEETLSTCLVIDIAIKEFERLLGKLVLLSDENPQGEQGEQG